MKTIYFVVGGIFTSTAFDKLEADGGEMIGPFATKAEAEDARNVSAARNFDICCHRLFIVPVEVAAAV
jgi:hypothetical protein